MDSKVSERDSKRYNLLDRIVGALGFGDIEYYESEHGEKIKYMLQSINEEREKGKIDLDLARKMLSRYQHIPENKGLNNIRIARKYLDRHSSLRFILGGKKSQIRYNHANLVLWIQYKENQIFEEYHRRINGLFTIHK